MRFWDTRLVSLSGVKEEEAHVFVHNVVQIVQFISSEAFKYSIAIIHIVYLLFVIALNFSRYL